MIAAIVVAALAVTGGLVVVSMAMRADNHRSVNKRRF